MFDELFTLPAVLVSLGISIAIIAYFWFSGNKAYREMSDEERAEFHALYHGKKGK